MNGRRGQLARRNDLFHLDDRYPARRCHQRIKILRGMPIDNVAVPVRFPALNERKITGNGLFKDVVLPRKLAHVFAGSHGRAVAGGRVKCRNARAARAHLFRQRALRREFNLEFAAQHLPLEQRVLADVRGHHFANLTRFEQ